MGAIKVSARSYLIEKIVKKMTNDVTHLFYVYYKRGHAKYLIVSRDIAKSGAIFLFTFYLAYCFTSMGIYYFHDQLENQHQADSAYCVEIYDNPDYFSVEEEKILKHVFSDIQKKTGIPIAMETITYHEWVSLLYSDFSNWKDKRYHELFLDEDHWLFVLSAGNPGIASTWVVREYHGDNTKKILTPATVDGFTFMLDNKLRNVSESNDYSVGKALCDSFSKFNILCDSLSEIDKQNSSEPIIGKSEDIILLALGIILGGISLLFAFINIKYIFLKYICRSQLIQISHDLLKKETICPVCHGTYVINIHAQCPHCGVKIERLPYGNSGRFNKNNITASSTVFDNIGSYGGDQGDMYRQTGRYFFSRVFSYNKELFEAARSYPQFKNYTNREISDLFGYIASEGCGYVAAVNSIFVHFKDDAERFQKLFGFSMIGTGGDYNFNRLLLDFHAITDNKIFLDYPYGAESLIVKTLLNYRGLKKAFLMRFGTSIFDEKSEAAISLYAAQAILDKYENDSVFTLDEETGVNPFTLSNRLLFYLDQHGITSTAECKDQLTISEINQQLAAKKTIIISAHGFSLYSTEEDLATKHPDFIDKGGHAMTVVGTTNKDDCIVSSWGKMYYLNLADVNEKRFLIIDIKP